MTELNFIQGGHNGFDKKTVVGQLGSQVQHVGKMARADVMVLFQKRSGKVVIVTKIILS